MEAFALARRDAYDWYRPSAIVAYIRSRVDGASYAGCSPPGLSSRCSACIPIKQSAWCCFELLLDGQPRW
jgi:hypothetical protein